MTCPSWSIAATPTQRPPSTSRSSANHCSQQATAVSRTSSTSARSISGAGGGPARVDDAGQRVAALPGQLQAALPVAVEHRAHGDELVDAARTLGDEDPDGVDVAQAGPGG